MHTSRHSPYTPLNLAGLGQDIFKHPPNTFCPLWVLWPLTGRPGRPEPGRAGDESPPPAPKHSASTAWGSVNHDALPSGAGPIPVHRGGQAPERPGAARGPLRLPVGWAEAVGGDVGGSSV